MHAQSSPLALSFAVFWTAVLRGALLSCAPLYRHAPHPCLARARARWDRLLALRSVCSLCRSLCSGLLSCVAHFCPVRPATGVYTRLKCCGCIYTCDFVYIYTTSSVGTFCTSGSSDYLFTVARTFPSRSGQRRVAILHRHSTNPSRSARAPTITLCSGLRDHGVLLAS